MVWVQKAVGGGDSEGDSSDSDSDDEEKDDDRDIQEEEDGVIADADADVSTSTSATDDINADSNSNFDPRILNNNWSFDQLYLTNEIASKNKLLLHLCVFHFQYQEFPRNILIFTPSLHVVVRAKLGIFSWLLAAVK